MDVEKMRRQLDRADEALAAQAAARQARDDAAARAAGHHCALCRDVPAAAPLHRAAGVVAAFVDAVGGLTLPSTTTTVRP